MKNISAGVARPVIGMHQDVHVTGRRILATVVDGLVFGAAMANFFGTIAFHDTFGVEVNLGGVAWAVWMGLIVLYYVLMEGYLGQTLGKMQTSAKRLLRRSWHASKRSGAT